MGGASIAEVTAAIIKEAAPKVGDKEGNPGRPKPDPGDTHGRNGQ